MKLFILPIFVIALVLGLLGDVYAGGCHGRLAARRFARVMGCGTVSRTVSRTVTVTGTCGPQGCQVPPPPPQQQGGSIPKKVAP